MSIIGAAILAGGAGNVAASLIGSSEQASAEQAAAGTISSSTQSAIQQLMQMVMKGQGAITDFTNQGVSKVDPFAALGQNAGNTLSKLLTPGPDQTATLDQLPGLAFLKNTGMWGVNNTASTSGYGGNVLTAANNFAQGTAETQWGTLVQQLQALTNTGAGAAATGANTLSTGGLSLGSLFGNAGQQISGLTQSSGQNVAQTQVGAANASAAGLTGAAGGLGNSLQMFALLKGLGGLGGSNSMPGTGGGTAG